LGQGHRRGGGRGSCRAKGGSSRFGVGGPRDTGVGQGGVGKGVARSARILVVEDNETLRTLLAQVLEGEGYVAIPAESGEEALEVARLAPPDLCLVDHVMPGMSGADLIRALRLSTDDRLRTVPAIGLSAYEGGRTELVAAGAIGAFGKPVAYSTLLDGIRRVLEGGVLFEGQAPA